MNMTRAMAYMTGGGEMSNALATIRQTITSPSNARMLSEAAPSWMRGDDLAARVAYSLMYSMAQNTRLAACTPDSLVKVAVDSVSLGLVPGGPLGQAYPVPFGREATLIIGYKGMIALAERSQKVAKVEARIVCDGDAFEVTLGTAPAIDHRPVWRERGEMYAVYAVATLKDGHTQFEVLTLDEVNKIRQRSRAKDNGPWVTDFEEMARKTAVKRLCKYLPMSVDMAKAIEIDARTDTGGTHAIVDAQLAEEAAREPKSAAQELCDQLPDVTPAADEVRLSTTEITLDRQVAAGDEVPPQPSIHTRVLADNAERKAAIAQDDDWESAYAGAVQVHDRASVSACLDALGLPSDPDEWRAHDEALATRACDILATSAHTPAADEMSVWVEMVQARFEA
jgi:recombination protein RecT